MNRSLKIASSVLVSLITIAGLLKAQIPDTIYINPLVSTHLITSEPIEYVDISSTSVAGDMPVSNILRLKPVASADSMGTGWGIVTIVCQKYMVQYALAHADIHQATSQKMISSMNGRGLLLPEITLSEAEMKSVGKRIQLQPVKRTVRKTRQHGIQLTLNKVCISGDYFFLDLSIRNKTNIPYAIDQLQFSLKDKKILKATNQQEIFLEPEYRLHYQQRIRETYRNVYVMKKFTFPNEKILEIRLTEKQPSGRTVYLQVRYQCILDAETI